MITVEPFYNTVTIESEEDSFGNRVKIKTTFLLGRLAASSFHIRTFLASAILPLVKLSLSKKFISSQLLSLIPTRFCHVVRFGFLTIL